MDISYLSLTDVSERLHQGKLSPVKLTRACLERIERLDDRLHSFITLTGITALQQARQAEGYLQKGKGGPLCGVPLALKDLFDTAEGAPRQGRSTLPIAFRRKIARW